MNTVFSFLSIPFLKLKKIPLVSWYSHFVMNFISKVSLKFSNSIFTASDEIYNSFKNKCVLTGHGINLSIFPPNKNLITETKKKSIVTVGRISPVKEYETLIEAIRILRVEEHKNIFLKIIGLPPDRDIEYHRKLKEKVDKLNLTNFIMFIGGIPYKELPKFLSEGDLFINMQCQGGVGKAVLEAMATGVPVMVCTKIFNIDFGEVKELLVFEKGNSKDLAQKVIKFFMLSRQKRRDLSDLMIALSKKHSLDNLINRIFESLEEHRIKFIRNN
jgi:glycosyltransferase involved in cell wall biosynthesis